MNITKEQTGEQTATLKIEIVPEDYAGNVQKLLKDYQKKASIPGFRPGHVPAGLIRKMYGKAVMADEVNKLLTDSLSEYIRNENLNILGNPMPNKERTQSINFEEGEQMEFFFDLGFAPEFEVKLDGSLEVEDYRIVIEDQMLDKYIEETRHRFAEYTHPDVADEKDMLSGEIVQVDAGGNAIEGGIKKSVYITLEKVKDEKARGMLAAMNKGDALTISPLSFFGSTEEAAAHLALKDEEAGVPELQVAFTLQDIVRAVPAELNADFYTKVYPGKDIPDFDAFRELVRTDAAAGFVAETDKLLFNSITETLVKSTPISLPDEFLKRWLRENDERPYSEEEIALQYPGFADSMRWQLIENKIIRDHNIAVTEADIKQYIKTVLLRQVDTGNTDPEAEKRYDSIVDAFMQNTEQVQRINDQLYNARLLELFKSSLSLKTKEVSYEEFVNLVSEKHRHEHPDHDHDHDHDHHHDHDHGHDHDHDHHHSH